MNKRFSKQRWMNVFVCLTLQKKVINYNTGMKSPFIDSTFSKEDKR
jgi:hypothetical protein